MRGKLHSHLLLAAGLVAGLFLLGEVPPKKWTQEGNKCQWYLVELVFKVHR